MMHLPQASLAWLASEGVTVEDVMTAGPHRFFRVVRRPQQFSVDNDDDDDDADLIDEICADIDVPVSQVARVEWLPEGPSKALRFYSLPPNAPLARARALQTGRIQGMDAASGAAVCALGVLPGHHVLDLCCSPGAKLLALYDCLNPPSCSSFSSLALAADATTGISRTSAPRLHGVDSSASRMRVCRNIVERAVIAYESSNAKPTVLPSASAPSEAETRTESSQATNLVIESSSSSKQPSPLVYFSPLPPHVHVQLIVADGSAFNGSLTSSLKSSGGSGGAKGGSQQRQQQQAKRSRDAEEVRAADGSSSSSVAVSALSDDELNCDGDDATFVNVGSGTRNGGGELVFDSSAALAEFTGRSQRGGKREVGVEGDSTSTSNGNNNGRGAQSGRSGVQSASQRQAGNAGDRKRRNKSARVREERRLREIIQESSSSRGNGTGGCTCRSCCKALEAKEGGSRGKRRRGKGQEDEEKGEEDCRCLSSSESSSSPSSDYYYDRVLVDAPCTHDGSFKHVAKLLTAEAATATATKRQGVATTTPEAAAGRGGGVAEYTEIGGGGGGGDDDGNAKDEESCVAAAVAAAAAAGSRVEGLLSSEAAAACVQVQQNLLLNGFRRLRPHTLDSSPACLVYSTCSLTKSQNEGVVSWLLEREPTAQLIPIDFARPAHDGNNGSGSTSKCSSKPVCSAPVGDGAVGGGSVGDGSPSAGSKVALPWAPGELPHTLRFTSRRGTSGLFVAKIAKVAL